MLGLMSLLLALVLSFLLPSVAALVAFSERDAGTRDELPPGPGAEASCSWDTDLARGLACGVSTWLIGSGLLAETVGLSRTTAWTYDVLVAAASVAVLLLPRHRTRVRAVLGPASARLGVVSGLGALVVAPVLLVVLRTSWSPLGSTPWYYLGLARQVAASGSMPRHSVEFATRAPFLDDYHLFTTATAMLLVQQPGHPVLVTTTMALLAILLLACGSVALASALGAGRTTALLTIPVALATGVGMMRLDAYRPEGFAIGLVVLVAAPMVDWYRRGAWASVATAGVLLAVLSQVHGIAALTAGVVVLAAGLAQLALAPRREQVVRLGLGLLVCGVCVGVGALVFHGPSGTTHAHGLFDLSGPADPTWAFYRAGRASLSLVPPDNGQMLYDVPGYLYGRSWWWVVPCVLLAAAGLWLGRRTAHHRRVVVMTVLAVVGLGLAGSVFMLGWASYVPRRTGASRIPIEASLLVPAFVALGLGSLATWRWRWRGREVPANRRRTVLVVALVACSLVTSVDVAGYDSGQALSRDDLAAWRSLPVKPGQVVLANAYTEGFIPDVTGGVGLVDGRAPYTFGHLLHRANRLIAAAQRFYGDPSEHWGFLRDNHVAWVVVGEASTWALSTGIAWPSPHAVAALDRCPGLRRVDEADAPRLTMFRVVDSGPAGCPASAAGG